MDRRNFLKGLLAAGVVTLVQPTFPVSNVAPAAKISFEEIVRITLDKYRPILAQSILNSSQREKVFTRIMQSRLSDGSLRKFSE